MLFDYLPRFLKKALRNDKLLSSSQTAAVAHETAIVPAIPPPHVEAPVLEEPAPTITEVEQIIQKVRPYSMVPDSGLEFLIQSVHSMLDQQIAGDFVECGVWKGGSAATMKLAEIARQPNSQRLLHLFDSYEGLPPAQVVDGPMAQAWQQAADVPGNFDNYDNCAASLELVQQNFTQLGLLDDSVKFYKGWFETTVPEFVAQHPELKIAILRLDGDWYESTKVCLENFYPLVSEKGVIIIDDYYAWDGCAVAVHEYLGKHGLNHRIRSLPDFTSAYMIKKAHREFGA